MLVLGGGSDLAGAITRALVGEGARTVVLAGRRPRELDPIVAGLRQRGATTVETVAFDADAPDGHRAFVEGVAKRHGALGLVLVAFGVLDGDDPLADPDAALGVLRTDLLGAASVVLAAAGCLRAQGHGTLVVLTGAPDERVRAGGYVHAAAKAGLDVLCQGLGDQLAANGVHVMVVRPGFVRTKLTAGRRPPPMATTPEMVAEVVVDGLRHRARVVWAPALLRYGAATLRLLPRGGSRPGVRDG